MKRVQEALEGCVLFDWLILQLELLLTLLAAAFCRTNGADGGKGGREAREGLLAAMMKAVWLASGPHVCLAVKHDESASGSWG